jgi:hypothetical protein
VTEGDPKEPGLPASAGRRPEEDPVRHRLDPDLAARAARADRADEAAPRADSASPIQTHRGATGAAAERGAAARGRKRPARQAIDTRPYRWAIGAFGLGLAIVISVALFLSRGVSTVGVAPGHRLHNFAAPVATSHLNGNANLSKPCRLGYLGSRAVNTCLLTRRRPLVIAFFVTGSSSCVREVDTLQKVSKQFADGAVGFAAVAVRASRSQTARLVRSHHWTVPVAYDLDGAPSTASRSVRSWSSRIVAAWSNTG